MYLTILIITNPLVAQNNRGENLGNQQTLQKITTPTGARTVCSSYSLKQPWRKALHDMGLPCFRKEMSDPLVVGNDTPQYVYGKDNTPLLLEAFPDDPNDLYSLYDTAFGLMMLEESSEEATSEDSSEDKKKSNPKTGDGKKAKKKALKLRGQIEVSHAVSTTMFSDDLAFIRGVNAGSTHPAPFGSERHYTRYAFTLTFNVKEIAQRWKVPVLPTILTPLKSLVVGGGHTSNASEFTPAVLAFRWHDTAGRGGLAVGLDEIIPVTNDIDLSFLERRMSDLGITDHEVFGQRAGKPSIDAGFQKLSEILLAANSRYKKG